VSPTGARPLNGAGRTSADRRTRRSGNAPSPLDGTARLSRHPPSPELRNPGLVTAGRRRYPWKPTASMKALVTSRQHAQSLHTATPSAPITQLRVPGKTGCVRRPQRVIRRISRHAGKAVCNALKSGRVALVSVSWPWPCRERRLSCPHGCGLAALGGSAAGWEQERGGELRRSARGFRQDAGAGVGGQHDHHRSGAAAAPQARIGRRPRPETRLSLPSPLLGRPTRWAARCPLARSPPRGPPALGCSAYPSRRWEPRALVSFVVRRRRPGRFPGTAR
jgi:hypothetical protein